MNWIDSPSGVYEVVTVGSCRINRLLYGYYLVLLASSMAVNMYLIVLQLRATKRATSPSKVISATMIRSREENIPEKIGEASPVGYSHGKRPRSRSRARRRYYISDLVWSRLFVWSQQNYQRLLKIVRYFETS